MSTTTNNSDETNTNSSPKRGGMVNAKREMITSTARNNLALAITQQLVKAPINFSSYAYGVYKHFTLNNAVIKGITCNLNFRLYDSHRKNEWNYCELDATYAHSSIITKISKFSTNGSCCKDVESCLIELEKYEPCCGILTNDENTKTCFDLLEQYSATL